MSEGNKTIRSRKSSTVFGVLVLAAIVIQVVRFVRLGPQLAAVSAATSDSTIAGSQVAPTHDVLLTFGAQDIDDCRLLMQRTGQVVQRITAYPSTQPIEMRSLSINPFRAGPPHIAGEDRAEQERADTLRAAQDLTLDAVMNSELAPVCLINNVLLREKQQVNGFTVDQIKSDSVIVHSGTYRFELRMLR